MDLSIGFETKQTATVSARLISSRRVERYRVIMAGPQHVAGPFVAFAPASQVRP